MSRKALLATLFVAALGFILVGCDLEADKESAMLPANGYGTTFKLVVDEVGPYPEIDELGKKTGRRGFYFDHDHNWYDIGRDEDVAKRYDVFYQIEKPSAGIVSIRWGADGYGVAGQPIAMAKLVPGKLHYEIPLESVTEWIKEENSIGYRPAKYQDEANKLVYFNPVTGEEYEAALTGKIADKGLVFESLGVVTVPGDGKKNGSGSSNEEDVYDEFFSQEEGGDYEPFYTGDVDAKCTEYDNICDHLSGLFDSNWSKPECKDKLFKYAKWGGREGNNYVRCLKDCSGDSADSCRRNCRETNLPDEYGCGGSYGPDVLDVFFVVDNDGDPDQRVFGENGMTLTGNDHLAIFVDYADVEENITGYDNENPNAPKTPGQMIVTFGRDEVALDLPTSLRSSSLKDGKLIGFTLANPLPEGRVDFTISLMDGGCGKIGEQVYEGYFNVEAPGNDENTDQIDGVKRVFTYYEIYSPFLTKYTVGNGFIDVRSLDKGYFYEIPDWDLGIMQGYIWSYRGTYDMQEADIRTINSYIFTTTQDTRFTKYDPTDDIGSFAFYVDQPLPSGAFTFYGDQGWNVYPKGPWYDNDDQAFIRGNFETTELYMPFAPLYGVDLKYTGCNASCETFITRYYDQRIGIQDPVFGNSEAGQADALESCKSDFGDDYWSCRVDCINLAEAELNGCVSLESCIEACPTQLRQGNQSFCQVADDIALKMRLNIDPAFLENCYYKKLIYGPEDEKTADCAWDEDEIANWEPLKLGVLGIADNRLEPLPGGYVDVVWPNTDYTIHLPFGPKIPLRFLFGDPDNYIQGQMYLALMDSSGQYYGTGFYPPNENSPDGDWAWLLLYAYNWYGPEYEGWSLTTISDNSILGAVPPTQPIIEIEFGDLRALEDDTFLDPNEE